MTADTHLNAALRRWKLPQKALPGIKQAWAAKFASLEAPSAATPADVLVECDPSLAGAVVNVNGMRPTSEGTLYVHTGVRHGDVYTEYEVAVPEDEVKRFLQAVEGTHSEGERLALAAQRRQYSSRNLIRPVWWVLAEHDPHEQFDEASWEMHSAKQEVASAKYELDTISALEQWLQALEDNGASGREFGYLNGSPALMPPGFSYNAPNDRRVLPLRAVTEAIETARHLASLAHVFEAHAEAEALPAGPLRTFLLSNESEHHAKRFEKSDLLYELDLAHRARKDATAQMRDVRAALTELAALWQKELAEAEENFRVRSEECSQLWAMGWPGIAPLPAMPSADESAWG